MKTVLLVEEYAGIIILWEHLFRMLGKPVRTFQASTSVVALELMEEFLREIDLAVLGNGYLDGRPTFGENGLIAAFRRLGFAGPMIAASANPAYRAQQRASGCDYEVEEKRLVPYTSIEILGL